MRTAVFSGLPSPPMRQPFHAAWSSKPSRLVGRSGLSLPGVAALTAAMLLCTGCTSLTQWWDNGLKVGPNYHPPGASVMPAWVNADDPDVDTGPMDYSYWWTEFNDPTLNRLVQAAYQQNLPIKVAALRVAEARAQRGIAVGNLFPQQQDFSTTYSRSTFSGASQFGPFPVPKIYTQNWSIGFDAAWELDFWGRFRRNIEAANADFQASIGNYDDVLVILQAEVAATYIQIRTLQWRLVLARQNLASQLETLRLTRIRAEGGASSRLDVTQAATDAAVTESVIPLLEASSRQAKNKLCILLGVPPQEIQDVLGPDPEPVESEGPEDFDDPQGPADDDRQWIPQAPDVIVVGVPAELLRRRPDIRRAEREVASQSARIGVAESELYPHFAVTGNIGVQASQFRDLFDINSIAGTIGPGFRWNVLNYGRILENVRVQDARFQQSVLNYRQTVLKSAQEVEDGMVAFLQEHNRLDALERGVQAAKESRFLSQKLHKEGEVTFDRVLEAQRILIREQDREAESQGNAALHLIAVYKALGGGWQMRYASPPAEIDPAAMPVRDEGVPADAAPPVNAPLPVVVPPPAVAPVP